MEGLSHWLRQIIAVVLLASLIDLILPNRTMQRYVRLVAGLFILMTVATPIIHWMKGDFSSKLAESLNSARQMPQGAANELAMIEEEGARLRNKQNVQAAELVSAKLESAIRKEIKQSENRTVQKVDVEVEQEADGSLAVTKVVIMLEPKQSAAESNITVAGISDVNPIAAVDIRIEVESWPREQKSVPVDAADAEQETAVEEAVDRDTRIRISALIASRFGLSARIVDVKQPASVTADSN
ncbi:stage III sporulation protein AF [Cohnella sp.]|uniref:stage III sporulation protein AF n=1 Tax=Cohnella sp. TaxID=1883426 RepID=UPI0035664F7A